ncbi:matrixin family metalloprotease [Myxococcus sp. CA039A]|uniref:matrixin family metalloprotease n=1 Tax=Myxococcus sp. CA039A TaxID=2741737 RepID=UPI00157B2105|nr:matrixin family metalloprotease [Myxococcus sp. CA039A]NTX57903.1 matrixin family metalloprotease [Myxococcus sp. CA039A]
MRKVCFVGWCLGVSLLLSACGSVELEPAGAPVGTSDDGFEEFKSRTYREPDSNVYVVPPDLAFDGDTALRAYHDRYVRRDGLGTREDALAVGCPNGVLVMWGSAAVRDLRYCVSRSFGTRQADVIAAMSSAAKAWEAVAGVNFIHESSLDGACSASQEGVVFDIRPVNTGGQYLARAFFPNAARSARSLLIDNTAFGNIAPLTLRGILRHELGHVLGFVHEPGSVLCPRTTGTCMLTETPDPNSVMVNYSCGVTAGDLVLSAQDETAVGFLYPL